MVKVNVYDRFRVRWIDVMIMVHTMIMHHHHMMMVHAMTSFICPLIEQNSTWTRPTLSVAARCLNDKPF